MVARTRIRTGTISVQKYDPLTLRLRGYESPTSDQSSNSHILGGRISKKKRFINSRAARVAKISKLKYKKPGRIAQEYSREAKVGFYPSVTIGTKEKAMSEYGRACKQVVDWEKILKEHEGNHPTAVPQIQINLEQMKKQRDYLKGEEWAHEVGDRQARDDAVQERIDILRRALKNTKPQAQRDNMEGAIACYESGQIGYSTKYTLFWAGQAVDQCNSYAEFTQDRENRLDRYEEMYGGHWLWYEEPLAAPPQPAMRCATAIREPSPTGLGLFNIHMGFQKEQGLVTRFGAEFPGSVYARNDAITAATAPDGRVWIYHEGPKLVFSTLLDSGAINASLYQFDLECLGVHPDEYPAQTITLFQTASGNAVMRTYDMKVEVVDTQNRSMVDEFDAVNPRFPPYLGAVMPVSMIENGNDYKAQPDALGFILGPGKRISGCLPFFSAYSSSTPGNNVILFGEDRKDVLGFSKMPAGRSWIMGASQEPRALEAHAFFGDPVVYFSHRDLTFIDQDSGKGVSTQTVCPGTDQEQQVVHDPGDRLNGGPSVYVPHPTDYRMDGSVDVIQPILYRNPYFDDMPETFVNSVNI